MNASEILTRIKIFRKHWEEGQKTEDLNSFLNAEKIIRKVMPEYEKILNEDKKALIIGFVDCAKFYFDYLCILQNNDRYFYNELYRLKNYAEKIIELDNKNFDGYYYKVLALSYELSSPETGDNILPNDNLLSGAINVFSKGIKLGVSSTKSAISKNNIVSAIDDMVTCFNDYLYKSPTDANYYLINGIRMADIGDQCKTVSYKSYQSINRALSKIKINELKFDAFRQDFIEEAKEMAMEIYVLAESKI